MKKIFSIVTLILIIFTGAILSGCAPDYGSLSLSLKNADKIEMWLTDEKVDYTIKINNYFDINAQFDFSFSEQKAKIVENSLENKGGGEYKFSIAPLLAGSTNLTITLKGLNKPLTIPVYVKKDVTSISARQNIFIKKGQSLKIDSSMFTFAPSDTTETGLTFKLTEIENLNYTENGITFDSSTNILTLKEDSTFTGNEISITATSTSNSDLTTNLLVKVVEDVNLTNFDVKIASQKTENPEKFGDFASIKTGSTESNVTLSDIEIVLSDKAGYKKQIKVTYDLFESGYIVEVLASSKLTLGAENLNKLTLSSEQDFTLSASDVAGQVGEKLTFKIYHKDLPDNYTTLEANVKVVCKPKSITVNGQKDLNKIELFTNDGAKEFKFDISPDKAKKEDYIYQVSFLTKDQNATEPSTNLTNFKTFVLLTYNKGDGNWTEVTDTAVFSDLNSSLKMTGQKASGTTKLSLKIECFEKNASGNKAENAIVTQEIEVIVYTGATDFKIKEIYENGTIYVPIGKTDSNQNIIKTYNFFGLEATAGEQDAVPGRLTISSNSKTSVCNISQPDSSSTTLIIEPTSVGEQTFVITTQNRKSVTLKVVVFREISESDLIFALLDSANNNIASYDESDNGNVRSITLKGIGSSVNISSKTKTEYLDYNENSFTYNFSINKASSNEYFSILNNKTITSKKFTEGDTQSTLTIKYSIFTVFDKEGNITFIKKSTTDTEKSINVTLKCVDYIKSVSLYASDKTDGEKENLYKKTNIYNKNDLSYFNQELATVHLFMNLITSSSDNLNITLTKDNFNFKSGVEEFALSGDNPIVVGDIGYFYPNMVNNEFKPDATTGYIGSFTYNYRDLRSLDSISIILEVEDVNTKTKFYSEVILNVAQYVDVESIWLSSPLNSIYLDSINSKKTINVQVMPDNAMFKDLEVRVESNFSNCLEAVVIDNTITLTYISAGSGKVLIFPKSRMKTNSPKDEFGAYYYHLELNFVCADGELEETALKISSLNDLKNVKANTHYYIDNAIDCNGEILNLNLGESGSIRGTFLWEGSSDFANDVQIGSINNFKVGNSTSGSLGLFGEVSKDVKIYNLSVSGFFADEYELSNNSNIGILCGTNSGTISNVTVELSKSNTVKINKTGSNSAITVNFGLVAGENAGTIQVNGNAKNFTLLANNENNVLSVCFDSNPATNSYLGGVVGNNTGTIQNTLNSENFITIGMYGINANVFICSNAMYLAGVAGQSSGTISGLKVLGEINGIVTITGSNNKTEEFYSKNVAGFVGLAENGTNTNNSFIKNNISRVFVRGKGDILSGFVANVDTTNVPIFENNEVQAVDTGASAGINASFMVYYGDYNADKIKATGVTAGVTAKSYFTRTLPNSLILDTGKKPTNAYKVSADLNLSNYYGEIICLDTDKITLKYADSVNDSGSTSHSFEKGQEDKFESSEILTDFVLAGYMQAKNADEQSRIKNLLDTKSLLDYANVLSNNLKDINIEIQSSNARQENYGQKICLQNVGALTIKISSGLNYTNSINLNLNVTNYYESIGIFEDKDKTIQSSSVQLINNKTTIVYFKAYSSSYNYNNTPIELATNNEVSFEVGANTSAKITATVQGQACFVQVKDENGNFNEFTGESLVLNTLFNLESTNYYLYKFEGNDTNKTITSDNNKNIFAFVSDNDKEKIKQATSSTATNPNLAKESISYKVKATTGIDNITLSKAIVEAEPTDNIEFNLSYVTFNSDDKVTATLRVYTDLEKGEYKDFGLEIEKNSSGNESPYGYFYDDNKKELFKLSWQEIDLNTFKYSFKMPIDDKFDLDVYNYLNSKYIELEFESEKTKQSVVLRVQYKPENISSVLVNNYSPTSNEEMITTNNTSNEFDFSKMIYSGNQTATGELNILNAYVYTKYSQFDYVDVSMELSAEGGFLGYIDYDKNSKIGKLSTNTVYTSNAATTTLRIYKNDIKEDFSSSNLLIGIVYRIPKTVQDGTYVPIKFKFYTSDELVMEESVTLLARLANQVSFEIYDKKVVNETASEKTYNVVRGKTYLLDTTIVGYSENEVVFESSNPSVASITKEGDNYYLTISNASIDYNDKDYFEVTIKSYGQKSENNKVIKSISKTTNLRIFDLLIDDEMFSNSHLNLRLLESTDIIDLIANKINYEYSRTYENIIETFKESFVKNAKLYIIIENGEQLLSAGNTIDNSEYRIVCSTKNEGIPVYKIIPRQISDLCDYQFKVGFKLKYKQGVPSLEELLNAEDSKSYTFTVSTYISSTGDNPTPIFNYQDLLDMKDDESYRLVKDIEIPASQFKMISVSPKLFDGNGHTIKIGKGDVKFELDSSSDFALFKTLNQDCIIKNVTMEIAGNLNITLDNSTSLNGANIALLVAENNGNITNCSVLSDSVVTVNIISTVSVMEKSYFAGIVAKNTGYITNCYVECNLTANGSSLAGLVAENTGSIASSYIKNSRIYNTTSTTNENIVTGGLCIRNSGNINMCYVEGAMSSATQKIYSDYIANDYSINSKIIYTSTKTAGFVYENSGNISDCYSNIPIVSTNESSGFVANAKSGKISRVFSLCKLKQQDTLNFGFVASHSQTDDEIIFEDCFFVIQNNIINYNTSQTNYEIKENKYVSKIKGIEPLPIAEFNVLDKNGNLKEDSHFSKFIVNNDKTLSVWFYVYDSNKEKATGFDIYSYMAKAEGFEDLKGYSQEFVARRLNLVSPNLKAYSQYDLEYKDETALASGEYTYVLADKYDTVGSKSNPYLISSASEFENFCNQKNGEYSYYRLICDIDYENEEIYSSNLFNKTLIGYFEGNGFSVSKYSVNSIYSNLSAGLFAQIGSSSTKTSCLKNVNFSPSYINLPNSVYVGGIAGTLVNANVCNVNVSSKNVIIVGKNIVGGMFGITSGETNLNSINSDIVAKASNYNTLALKTISDVNELIKEIQFLENTSNKTKVSYAGALVGYVGGLSNIKNANVGENAKTLGMIAGLMFGGVGSLAKVSDFSLVLNSFDNEISAYVFGGYVAGEFKGTLSNFEINSEIVNSTIFNCYPIKPTSVGGVAGYAKGAIISNLTSKGYTVVGANIIGKESENYLKARSPYIATYVGGVVGYGDTVTFDTIKIGEGETTTGTTTQTKISGGLGIFGGNYVGGVIGYAYSSDVEKNKTTITNCTIVFENEKTYTNKDNEKVTDKLYFSYVSNAIGEDIKNYEFSSVQKTGALVGGYIFESADKYLVFAGVDKDGNAINNNTIYLGTNLDIIFEDYKLDDEHKPGNINKLFNVKGVKETNFNSNKIIIKINNLGTSETNPYGYNQVKDDFLNNQTT